MSEISLKPGWKFVKITDCCNQISERIDNPSASGLERFVGLEHMQTRETIIREWGSTDDVTSTMKLFESGDVLVARRNVYLERAAKADFDGVCSGDAIVLRPKDKHCLPELLPFILNTDQFWAYANSQADGSMSKRLSVARLMNYEFALPQLDEQQRIVNALYAFEILIQQYMITKKIAFTLLQTIQENLLLNTKQDDSDKEVKLSSLMEINPTDPQLKSNDYFVPMEAVEEWSKEITKFEKKGKRGGIRAQAGDVLLARITPCLENGKTAIVPEYVSKCGGSTEFIVLRGNENMNSNLIYWITTSPTVRNHAIGLMHGSTGRQRLSPKDLGSIKVKLIKKPQRESIVKILENIYKSQLVIDNRLLKIKALKHQTLNKTLN